MQQFHCKQELFRRASLRAAKHGAHRVSLALKARASALRELLQRTSRCRRVNMMSSFQLHSCSAHCELQEGSAVHVQVHSCLAIIVAEKQVKMCLLVAHF